MKRYRIPVMGYTLLWLALSATQVLAQETGRNVTRADWEDRIPLLLGVTIFVVLVNLSFIFIIRHRLPSITVKQAPPE